MKTTAKSLLPALALATLLFGMPAHAEHFVVAEVRGTGQWRVGTSVDGSTAIALRQGQHLELISERGSTIELDGPYSGPASSKGEGGIGLMASLGAFVTERQARIGEVGTTRGQKIHDLPGPWLIDATHAGSACMQESATPVFWRPASARQSTIVVAPDDRSWKATESWPVGEDRLTATAQMPMRTGAIYFVSLDGAEVAIKLTNLPASLSNDEMRAAWMANKGCEAQARALIHARK
jgi:hypothetical protein